MSDNDYDVPAAHSSDEHPLDHIGDPVVDPCLPGAVAPGQDPVAPVDDAGQADRGES